MSKRVKDRRLGVTAPTITENLGNADPPLAEIRHRALELSNLC